MIGFTWSLNFTTLFLLLDVRENATVVPQKALIIEKGGAHIFVMRKDSTVERRFIELGPEFENDVVVERGLSAGEMIVYEGFHKLAPGMKVRVQDPAKLHILSLFTKLSAKKLPMIPNYQTNEQRERCFY